ncbi:alpha/beta hydrolase [Cohnella lubricantis]|uniref:Alpha/beta hydrolase n=1 Tax=Cohnella lubricantis TaxID=2163172 RepID=A0A841TJA2_9BACL|nr:alpha/beta hydrolase [Cohnella lubricantis]MBB6679007.1 alpha/beta hydrolase [Cohnella lubricantis]MBP2119505.1 fermentation-respiration switch protein FrsA (DUF1100 family) [Cohnella lubricantis]
MSTAAAYNSYPLEALPAPALPDESFTAAAAIPKKKYGWISTALISIIAAAFFLFSAASVVAAWAISYPPVGALASNPMLARGLAYEDVSFPSLDGSSQVNGWWIPSASGRTVVLSHGYGTNREEEWVPMYDIASLLHGLDYNVLMFDYGYANAEHRLPATGGVTESQQLLGALEFAKSQGSSKLIVWGFSMGAGTALQAALQTDLIDGMILDSTFIPDEESIYYNINRYVNLPKSLATQWIRKLVPMFSGASLDQIPSAEVQSTAFPYPILLIHGTDDDKSPAAISENIAASQTNPLSQLWSVPGAIHEMIFRTHPEEYVQRTTAFLQAIDADTLASIDAQ